MNPYLKHLLVPASIAGLAVTTAVSMGLAQDGTGGNRGTPTTPSRTLALAAPGGADTPTVNLLLISTAGGANLTLMNATTGAVLVTYPGILGNASGLSNLPGTLIFTMTGGMAIGGTVSHLLPNGSIINVGPSGFASVPGCEWAEDILYGSAESSLIGDTLVVIDPFSGFATPVGGGYGSGIAGIDCLGFDTTSGILWASTGFFYDGSPGDEIIIDRFTGLAFDTGVDMLDAGGAGPSCTVASMTFDILHGHGYIGIGCGVGDVYRWQPGGSLTAPPLGNTGDGSASGIQAIF